MRAMAIKVLNINYDRNVFVEGSAVEARMKEYGNLFEELHLVTFAKKSLGLKEKQISPNVWVYPTNSISRWFYVRDAARLGKKLVLEKGFVRGKSIISAQDPFESGLVGLKIKKRWRIPLQVEFHTDPFSPYFKGFLNNLRKRIALKVLKQADSVRVVTDSLKDKVQKEFSLNPEIISVLPIYVDRQKIEGGRVTFDLHARYGWTFILLAVARLSPEKNLPLALEALAMVLAGYPDTGLVIVGSGPEEGRLKALAKKLRIDQQVAFAGWQEDLASYYATANAFVQTSFFEGYGLALVEAGLWGLPIVTTAVGLAQELENGVEALIVPPEASSFASAINGLIEHNFKREDLKIRVKRAIESKLMSKEAYLPEYRKMLERGAGRVLG